MRHVQVGCVKTVLIGIAALLFFSSTARAQTPVTLTATDNPGTSSFNSSLHWSDSLTPHGDADYLVTSNLTLRTPENSGDYVFGGASMTLSNAYVNLKGTGNITVGDLRLYSCRLAQGINGTVKLYGTNTVYGTSAAPSRYSGSQNRITELYATLQGSGEFQIERTSGENSGDFACRLRADNSDYTGTITVTGWGIKLGIASPASLGGELSEFRADALMLKNSGTLYNLSAMTLNTTSRGITVSGGGTLDAAYGDLTIEEPITGSGTLNVRGNGYSLTLNAAVTMAGNLEVIDQGQLVLGPDFSLPLSQKVLVTGGFLTGTNPVINDITVQGGAINPGTVGGVDSLTVSNVTFSSGAFAFDFAAGTNADFLTIVGDLTKSASTFVIRLGTPVTNECGRFPLLTASNLGDYTADDFTLEASYYNLPEGTFELADDGDGLTLFFVQARPVVELTASGNNASDSFSNGARWSDGQVPNSANDYLVAHGYRLRTDANTTATVAFGGHSLTLAEGSDMRCKGLRAYIGDLRLFNLRITQGTPPNTQYIDGRIVVQAPYDFENDGSLSRVLVIESQMSGTADIRFKMSVENPLSTINGKFEMTAANTNFTGGIKLQGPNVTYLTISDENNLGGNPPVFRSNQLELNNTSVLQVVTSVLLDDVNRGITLSGTGGILDAGASGATLTVACPVTGTTLYKRGAGTLVLGRNNSYTNGTIIEAGALEAASENALGTGPATFAAGTSLRVPRDNTTLPLGVRLGGATPLTVTVPLPLSPLFGAEPLPKAFDLPVFLLTGTTSFDTALLAPQDTPSGYTATVETRTVDDLGTPRTQVYVHYLFSGTLIMVR